MFRSDFLQGALALATGSTATSLCDLNGILPSNRPLDLTMRALDGPDVNLQAYRGYAVWINIFATTQDEQPTVARLAAEYYGRGLRVIGIDVEESDDVVRQYRKRLGLTYPIVMDAKGTIAGGLQGGVRSITSQPGAITLGKGKAISVRYPADIFLKPSGYVSCNHTGTMDEQAMRDEIERIISQAVLPSKAPPMYSGGSSSLSGFLFAKRV